MLGDAERALSALLALRELRESQPADEVPLESLAAMAGRRSNRRCGAGEGRAGAAAARFARAGAAARAFGDALAWMDAASEHLAGAGGFAGAPAADDRSRYLDQLRNNLTLDSLSFRHAARFAVTGAASR